MLGGDMRRNQGGGLLVGEVRRRVCSASGLYFIKFLSTPITVSDVNFLKVQVRLAVQ